jgi:hypothetical protein
LPVLELLRGHFGIQDADDPATCREKVRSTLTTLDPALDETLPYLYGLLGIVGGPDPIARWLRKSSANGRSTRSSASS